MKRNRNKCDKCHRDISLSNFDRHYKSCFGPIKKKIRGIDFDPNHGYKNGSRVGWNKGLTKEIDSRVLAGSESIKLSIREGKFKPGPTEKGKERLSQLAKERGLGGYRPHPNKGVYYNGVWLDSKWEQKVAISLDENGIKWIRPTIGFVWTDDGNKYYPDFYLPEFDVYIDPKNSYLQKKDKLKISESMKRHNICVILLSEHQLSWNAIKELMMVRRFGKAQE